MKEQFTIHTYSLTCVLPIHFSSGSLKFIVNIVCCTYFENLVCQVEVFWSQTVIYLLLEILLSINYVCMTANYMLVSVSAYNIHYSILLLDY